MIILPERIVAISKRVLMFFFFSPIRFSLSGCPLNAQAIKKGKISEELMTIKLKASGGKEICKIL